MASLRAIISRLREVKQSHRHGEVARRLKARVFSSGRDAAPPNVWDEDFAANISEVGPPTGSGERARPDDLVRSPDEVGTVDGKRFLSITWIVPGLLVNGGGHRNILRAAYHLHTFGHTVRIYFTNTALSDDSLRAQVHAHFYPLNGNVHRYAGEIEPTDVLIATHWPSVDTVLRHRDRAQLLAYFVQDFEPFFYPMGSEYILAENTYKKGLYHVCSGPWCEHILRTRYAAEADHFRFPVDTRIYFPRPLASRERKVLFFAKPEMPRRCFEIGVRALRDLHPLVPDHEIVLFGSKAAKAFSYDFPVTIKSVVPSIEDLAELYSSSTLGIVFSTTNPSLVPYEMMACGLPVVDLGIEGNEVNYGGRRDIALLGSTEPSRLAQEIADLLRRPDELGARSRAGRAFVQTFPNELEAVRRIEDLLLRRIARSPEAKRALES